MYKFSSWFLIQLTPFFIDLSSIWRLVCTKPWNRWVQFFFYRMLNLVTENLVSATVPTLFMPVGVRNSPRIIHAHICQPGLWSLSYLCLYLAINLFFASNTYNFYSLSVLFICGRSQYTMHHPPGNVVGQMVCAIGVS